MARPEAAELNALYVALGWGEQPRKSAVGRTIVQALRRLRRK
jgi:hypothetical protein